MNMGFQNSIVNSAAGPKYVNIVKRNVVVKIAVGLIYVHMEK